MRDEYIQHGEILPTIFPSGPKNPMGSYALYLGKNYAIHGINTDYGGIGLRVTRGCIRLRSKDIKYLYTLIPVGTRVQFINEPVKTTTGLDGMQYLEIHRPLVSHDDNNYEKNYQITITKLKKHVYLILENIPNINYSIVRKALEECTGIPINITYSQKEQ